MSYKDSGEMSCKDSGEMSCKDLECFYQAFQQNKVGVFKKSASPY